MAKLSVRAASMQFEVSRPTITKWIKNGKISAERLPESEGGGWVMDSSELIRLGVKVRGVASGGSVQAAPETVSSVNNVLQPDVNTLLQRVADAEKRAIEAEAAAKVAEANWQAAERVAAKFEAMLDAATRMLPEQKKDAVQDHPKRRWWHWG